MQLYLVRKLRLFGCWIEGGCVEGHSPDWNNDWGSQEKDSVGWS